MLDNRCSLSLFGWIEVGPMAFVHGRPGTARRFAFGTRFPIVRRQAISGQSVPVLKMCRAVPRGASFLPSGWPRAEAREELGNDLDASDRERANPSRAQSSGLDHRPAVVRDLLRDRTVREFAVRVRQYLRRRFLR